MIFLGNCILFISHFFTIFKKLKYSLRIDWPFTTNRLVSSKFSYYSTISYFIKLSPFDFYISFFKLLIFFCIFLFMQLIKIASPFKNPHTHLLQHFDRKNYWYQWTISFYHFCTFWGCNCNEDCSVLLSSRIEKPVSFRLLSGKIVLSLFLNYNLAISYNDNVCKFCSSHSF